MGKKVFADAVGIMLSKCEYSSVYISRTVALDNIRTSNAYLVAASAVTLKEMNKWKKSPE
jgi:hypothetical protein